MYRVARRTKARSTLLALAGVCMLAAASPAGGMSTNVGTAVEAWYQGNALAGLPICELPIACPEVAPPGPTYPDQTLHVGMAGGRETARTYFELDLSTLPADSVLTGGTVRLPLAELEAGTTAPELAELMACLVGGFIEEVYGGPPEEAPPVDCSVSSPLEYDPEAAVFTFDLGPLIADDMSFFTLGIAIVGSPEAEPAAWRVVFNGRGRDVEDAEPITAELHSTALPQDGHDDRDGDGHTVDPGTTHDGVPPPAANPLSPTAGGMPPVPGSTVEPPATDPDPPQVADPAPSAHEPEPARPVASSFAPRGYAYPQVWLLPLAFLAVGGLLIRSLSGDYDLAPDGRQRH